MEGSWKAWVQRVRSARKIPWCVGVGGTLLWGLTGPELVPAWLCAVGHAAIAATALQVAQAVRPPVREGASADAAFAPALMAQALGIVERQVQVGIAKSEAAVMDTVDQLGRIQQLSVALHSEASGAIEHSNTISGELQKLAAESQTALRQFEQQQQALAHYQACKDAQVAQAMHDVASLSPFVEMIGSIAKQTHLLSFNAAIEAARAGNTGNGFKIVATEVRALAQQTTEAAKHIKEGIEKVQKAVQSNNARYATELRDMLTSVEAVRALLTRSVNHSAELGPFLLQLSHGMDQGTAAIRDHVVQALGQMQFQDVLRQLLEQAERELHMLAEHSHHPGPPLQAAQALQALVAQWQESYVMLEQRLAHGGESAAPAASGEGAKIELF